MGNARLPRLRKRGVPLDKFLPRITLGKVAPPPVSVQEAQGRRGIPVAGTGSASEDAGEPDPKGFAYLNVFR